MSIRGIALLALVIAPAGLSAQGKVEVSVPLAELQRRVRADSNDPAAHYNVAMGDWQAKEWEAADRELRAAIALQPRFAEAHLALAFLPFVRDQHMLDGYTSDKTLPDSIKAAIKQRSDEYRRAFVIDPLVDLRIIAAASADPDWRVMDLLFGSSFNRYVDGLAACQQGNYAECESTLGSVITDLAQGQLNDSKVPTAAFWYRGIAAAHTGHFDVAIADFTRLIARDQEAVQRAEEKGLIRSPMHTNEYRYFVGVFQQLAGRTDDAIATFRQAAEGDLGLYMAHVRLADIYEARKGEDYARAVDERRNAINANPDDQSLQLDLGVTLGKAGDFTDAETALETATERLPRDYLAWYWLGVAEQVLGKKPEARAAFERVVALAPSRMQDLVARAKQRLGALP